MLIYTSADEEDKKKNIVNDFTEETAVSLNHSKNSILPNHRHIYRSILVHTLGTWNWKTSTYSPTITTIQKRRYITKKGRNIFVTNW